jgi:hypothetical protein
MVRKSYEDRGLITAFDLRADKNVDHHPFVNSRLAKPWAT